MLLSLQLQEHRLNTLRDFGIIASIALFLLWFLFVFNYKIGVPAKEHSGCLDASLFLVSRHDNNIERGGLYVMTLDRDMKNAKKGTQLLKRIAGIPGDHIKIEMDGVRVNDSQFYRVPLAPVSRRLGVDPKTFMKQDIIVPAGKIFVIGNTDKSYDSRFWGYLNETSVVGRAYALL